jgi:hypothetical protein
MNYIIEYEKNGIMGIKDLLSKFENDYAINTEFDLFLDYFFNICKINFETINLNLMNLGYLFGSLPEDLHYWKNIPIISKPSKQNFINNFESSIGPLPFSIKSFYRKIGGVNFIGYHPDWPEIHILDPVFIEDLNEAFLDSMKQEKQDWIENKLEFPEEYTEELFSLPLSPDSYHKANISGGPPYSVYLTPNSFDCVLNNFHAANLYFLEYIKLAFTYGGFPGLHYASPETKNKIPLVEIKKNIIEIK